MLVCSFDACYLCFGLSIRSVFVSMERKSGFWIQYNGVKHDKVFTSSVVHFFFA